MTATDVVSAPAPSRPQPRPSRPLTEYWDVFTASWRTRGPVVPAPRQGD